MASKRQAKRLFKLYGFCLAFTLLSCSAVYAVETNSLDIKNHMLEQVVPNSNALFSVANQAPETAEAWTQLKKQVVKLNTSAKWLQNHSVKDRAGRWQALAKNFSKATTAAVKAVVSQKPDVVSEAGDVVYQSCEGCHQVFLNQKTAK